MSKDVKADRRYTRDHEWAKREGSALRVGITAFAVEQLGDITLVNFDVAVGDRVEAGKAFGTIESVKTLSDLFAPVSGEIIAINAELADRPELVNEDPWDKAWMVAIAPEGAEEESALLDAEAYARHVEASG